MVQPDRILCRDILSKKKIKKKFSVDAGFIQSTGTAKSEMTASNLRESSIGPSRVKQSILVEKDASGRLECHHALFN